MYKRDEISDSSFTFVEMSEMLIKKCEKVLQFRQMFKNVILKLLTLRSREKKI
jgi:hypothetical protein